MFLQILPPDFQYESEVTLVNKAEIISFICLSVVFGIILLLKFINTKKPSLFSEIKFILNFIAKVISKDLKIN